MVENEFNSGYSLTLFSYGGGQDSRYLLDRIAKDQAFREKHVSDHVFRLRGIFQEWFNELYPDGGN